MSTFVTSQKLTLGISRKGGTGGVGTGGGGWVTCTCWLLWLSVEMPWLALGGPILALFAQI